MAVWSGELHISSVKLQMTSYGLYSESFFRLSSTSDPGKFLNIQTRGEGKVHSIFLRLHFACVSEQNFYFFGNLMRDHVRTVREKCVT
jgi:hypothetical protein